MFGNRLQLYLIDFKRLIATPFIRNLPLTECTVGMIKHANYVEFHD